MIFGGIPFYLGYVDPGLSLAQNVDELFFSKGARLRDEYDRLFASVFQNPDAARSVVRLLYTRSAGYTRREISERLGMSDGGRLSQIINALVASDFVVKYIPFGLDKRQTHYKLVDPFCLFYLHFLDGRKNVGEGYWQQNVTAQPVTTWRGLAFENVCFQHIPQIKEALGIAGVATTSSAWSKRADGHDDAQAGSGTQIDLLICRNDNVVNMCEAKFYGDDFTVDKDYYRVLLHRHELLTQALPRRYSIRSVLITTFGLHQNEYSGAFQNVVTLDDLFR